jgi:hypothetical protein
VTEVTVTKEKGILFATSMVQAILEGHKTQTRRPVNRKLFKPKITSEGDQRYGWATIFSTGEVFTWDSNGIGGENWQIKNHPNEDPVFAAFSRAFKQGFVQAPLGGIGDRLYVRETWGIEGKDVVAVQEGMKFGGEFLGPFYKATETGNSGHKWRPSIHMPKWAARIWLELTDVRVEKIQSISREDAKAEGFHPSKYNGLEQFNGQSYGNAELAFQAAWRDLYGSWEHNPIVWVYEFKVIRRQALSE